jgi:hypothetical protein
MNFAGGKCIKDETLELKYCERCGGLWLRDDGNEGVYCRVCRAYFASRPTLDEVPVPKERRRRRSKKKDGPPADAGAAPAGESMTRSNVLEVSA